MERLSGADPLGRGRKSLSIYQRDHYAREHQRQAREQALEEIRGLLGLGEVDYGRRLAQQWGWEVVDGEVVTDAEF